MSRCKICGNNADNKKYVIKERQFGMLDAFDYFKCSACGCLQIKSFPKDIGEYYPKNYYSFNLNPEKKYKKKYFFIDNWVLNKRCELFFKYFFRKTFKRRTALFQGAQKELQKDWKILDIGCGEGLLLYALSKQGYSNCLGIDPFIRKNITFKNGLKILKKDIFELDESDKFDFIMMHHSLEHMDKQEKTLTKARKLLKKNGRLLIRIPVCSSEAWKKYKENWVQADAPRHFFLHTDKSLNLIAKKSGLTLDKTVYDSNEFQFIGSEMYSRNLSLQDKMPKDLKRKLSYFFNKSKKLNDQKKGDQACFYFKVK